MPQFLDLCDICSEGVISEGKCGNCGAPAPVIGGQGKEASSVVGDAVCVLVTAAIAVGLVAVFVAAAK